MPFGWSWAEKYANFTSLEEGVSLLKFRNLANMKITGTENPLVTVYVTTKNRLQLLRRALTSLEAQTADDFEVIVVNDASDDDTRGFLDTFNPGFPLTVIHNESTCGAPASRNKAINRARGRFITGLDDDDTFMPDRIRTFAREWNDTWSLLAADCLIVNGTSKVRWKKKRNISYNDLLYRNLIGNQVFTLTERVRSVGGFDETLTAAQDYDLWLRLVNRFGPARTLPVLLQEIHETDTVHRITSQLDFNWGYYHCYLKHKAAMSPLQRAAHLYNIRRSRNKPVTLWETLSSTPVQFWPKELARRLR